MRSIELTLKNLETRLKRVKKPDARFCTEHFPEPRILFTEEDERRFEEEEKAGTLDICPKCGKRFPPGGPKLPVICFHHTDHTEESEVE